MNRLRPGLAVGVALGFSALASPAHALTISGTSVKTLPNSTPVHADARTKSVIYYLDLHAGPTDERFSVSLTPPEFATTGTRDEGQAIDGPLQFTLYGPGTVGTVTSDPAFGELCSSRQDRFHGYATGKAVVDVALPANANTTLAIRYGAGRRAPWADTDLRLRFGFQPSLVGTYDASSPLFGPATDVAGAANLSITKEIPVSSKGSGSRIGAHLILKATPNGTYGDGAAARKITRTTNVRVAGRLLPALAGKRVLLQWAKPGSPLRTAKSLKTTKGGRFTATLRAPGKGAYELWASYPTQPGPLTSDSTSCPLRYAVR